MSLITTFINKYTIVFRTAGTHQNTFINKYTIVFRTAGTHQKTQKQSKKIATGILINFENNIAFMLLESSVTWLLHLDYFIKKKKFPIKINIF